MECRNPSMRADDSDSLVEAGAFGSQLRAEGRGEAREAEAA